MGYSTKIGLTIQCVFPKIWLAQTIEILIEKNKEIGWFLGTPISGDFQMAMKQLLHRQPNPMPEPIPAREPSLKLRNFWIFAEES